MKKVDDLLREMREFADEQENGDCYDLRNMGTDSLRIYVDLIDEARKRERELVHRAMVIIAGIEMESSENPPRLWTALEDAYESLSEAMGMDGDTAAGVEEAKATGRHFVVRPFRNEAAIREALRLSKAAFVELYRGFEAGLEIKDAEDAIEEAYAAPARNCDRQFRNAHDVLSRFTEETGRQIFSTTDVVNWLLFAEAAPGFSTTNKKE